jgi:hypothetical protein
VFGRAREENIALFAMGSEDIVFEGKFRTGELL